MSHSSPAQNLHGYLRQNHANKGMPLIAFIGMARENLHISNRDIIPLVNDHPHLFEVKKVSGIVSIFAIIPKTSRSRSAASASASASYSMQTVTNRMNNLALVHNNNGHSGHNNNNNNNNEAGDEPPTAERVQSIGSNREKRLEQIALDFYNQVLRNNPYLRQCCQDRNKYTEEYSVWKENESRTNRRRNMTNSSPGTILLYLKNKLKLVDAVADGDVIIWTEKPNVTSGSTRNTNNNGQITDRRRRIKDVISKVRHGRKELEKNRNGVEIDPITFGLDFDNGDIGSLQTELVQEVKITNRSSASISVHVKDQAAIKKGVTVTMPRIAANTKTFQLRSNFHGYVKLSYTPNFTGIMRTILSFEISSEQVANPFPIVKYIQVRSGDANDYTILKPTAPYERKKMIDRGAFTNPERMSKEERKQMHMGDTGNVFKTLQRHGIPKFIREKIGNDQISDELISYFYGKNKSVPEEVPSDLMHLLNIYNYGRIFERLLWIEESQMEIDIKSYDMKRVPLQQKGRKYYSIHVPGLAESRPSVLRGDVINVRTSNKCFEGVVERTEEENAIIVFPNSIKNMYTNGMLVDVRFSFKRMGLRLCHDALHAIRSSDDKMVMFKKILFPTHGQLRALPPLNSRTGTKQIRWVNRNLNDEQRNAVQEILKAVYRPAPYILFGPPGTGKTVTLVEAILQTIKSNGTDPSFRLLVCAPSNMATDLIVERLANHLTPSEMLRIFAYSRDRSTVPQDIMNYSHYSDSENGFVIPPSDLVKKKKVVCITITTGGKLPFNDIKGHFTHVFVDEAGHSLEPEILSCIAKTTKTLSSNPPAIVLAGDPKQLGPIIRSSTAKSFGLEKSLLERLYQRLETKEDSRIMTTLVQNYRSHKAILKLPSDRFYGGRLQPKADFMVANNLQNWEHLPGKNFPLIFHGVEGQDSREGNSPSWFNSEECQIVKQYVDLLINGTRSNRVKAEEIGIVSPYHKQVQKISMLLRQYNHGDVKVGSVEEYQGSEKRVIIISTVRSSVEYLGFDNKHKLGFVSNPKRFNVAITRAQALLIVIGNPYVLGQDPDWKAFIDYCIEGGGYSGCDYNCRRSDDSDVDEMSMISLSSLVDDRNDDDEDGFIDVSAVTGQEGPAWRSEE